jgi:hypothetical protein
LNYSGTTTSRRYGVAASDWQYMKRYSTSHSGAVVLVEFALCQTRITIFAVLAKQFIDELQAELVIPATFKYTSHKDA